MNAQLELFANTDQLPADLFAFSAESWDNLLASEEIDAKYPVEQAGQGTSPAGRWSITLRQIEHGVWLWGADVYCKKRQTGIGFYPFRKWGQKRAAMSRETAIDGAMAYIENFLRT